MNDYPYTPPHPKYRLDRSLAEMNYQHIQIPTPSAAAAAHLQSSSSAAAHLQIPGTAVTSSSSTSANDSKNMNQNLSLQGLNFSFADPRLIQGMNDSQYPQNLITDHRQLLNLNTQAESGGEKSRQTESDVQAETTIQAVNSNARTKFTISMLPDNQQTSLTHAVIKEAVKGSAASASQSGVPKRKPCPECGKLLANVNEHVKSVHWQVKNYVCDLCDYSSSFKHDLVKHSLSKNHQYKKMCQDMKAREAAGSKTILVSGGAQQSRLIKQQLEGGHYRGPRLQANGQQKAKTCRDCGKMVENLNEHLRTVHQKEKNFMCKQCDYKTLFKSDLTKHQNAVHHGIRKACGVCGKQVANLSEHIRFVHEQAKDYKCDHCAYACVKPADLRKHIIAVHKFGTGNRIVKIEQLQPQIQQLQQQQQDQQQQHQQQQQQLQQQHHQQ